MGLTIEQQEKLAVGYVQTISTGGMEPSAFADDMTFWAGQSGEMSRADYVKNAPKVKDLFRAPMTMTVDALTSQPGRSAVECRGAAVLSNGSDYSNNYIFVVEFNDAGQIRRVREYADTVRAKEIMQLATEMWAGSD